MEEQLRVEGLKDRHHCHPALQFLFQNFVSANEMVSEKMQLVNTEVGYVETKHLRFLLVGWEYIRWSMMMMIGVLDK